MKYDCIVIGAGPAGIFTAYEIMLKQPKMKVMLIDKGLDIYSRRCPILTKDTKKCPPGSCKPACSITSGFGGAGAYSDGKFNITSEFGGWLNSYLDNHIVDELIDYVDQLNLEHGATKSVTDPYTSEVKEIERLGYSQGLKLLRAKIRHLGTEQNIKILQSIYEKMKDSVDFHFGKKVEELIVKDNKITGVRLNGDIIDGAYVVVATGRDGSDWMKDKLSTLGVKFTNNQVDIGVRVETNDIIMEKINEHLYEGKFIFRTSVGTTVRTFCSNPSGHVVVENHSGIMLANGHAYKDKLLGSDNTNFALLVSHEFEDPFNQPNEFAREVSKLANRLSNGSIIVQKYGDIKAGRRTTEKRISEGFVNPTLTEAVPGDLGLVLPYNTMKSLIEMTEALDYVTPGIASEHTLFYGVEAKFYSARPHVNNRFETSVSGLYVGGDGAGITRGLAQAGANGIWIARDIIDKFSKLL